MLAMAAESGKRDNSPNGMKITERVPRPICRFERTYAALVSPEPIAQHQSWEKGGAPPLRFHAPSLCGC